MWVSMRELKEVIGKDAAQKLCRNKGGVLLYVASTYMDMHPLVPLIGAGAYRALCLEYGGMHIEIPNGRKLEPRKDEVLAMLDKGGVPIQEIARLCGVSARYVRLLARLTPDQRKKKPDPASRAGLQQLSLPF
jgi:hypothetical protein